MNAIPLFQRMLSMLTHVEIRCVRDAILASYVCDGLNEVEQCGTGLCPQCIR